MIVKARTKPVEFCQWTGENSKEFMRFVKCEGEPFATNAFRNKCNISFVRDDKSFVVEKGEWVFESRKGKLLVISDETFGKYYDITERIEK